MTIENFDWVEGLATVIHERHFRRLSAEYQHELLRVLASKLKKLGPQKPEMKEEDVAKLHLMLDQPIKLLWPLIPESKGSTGKNRGLMVRAMNSTNNRGITQIGQFVQKTEEELLRWLNNLGPETLNAMKEALTAFSQQCGVQIEVGMDVKRWCP